MKKIPIRKIKSNDEEKANSEQFSIRKVQDLLGEGGLKQELHRHDFYFILLLEKGRGRHEIDFTSYAVRNNSVFFLRPGQVHLLELAVGCTGYLIEFSTEFWDGKDQSVNQPLRKVTENNHYQLKEEVTNKLNTVLAYAFREFVAKNEGYREIIKSNLEIFFIEMLRQLTGRNKERLKTNSYQQERFDEFSALVETHIGAIKSVAQYAERMNLSPYQLNQISKNTVGKTASELINEHIILEARRWLLATSSQIKDIADHLGYEDISYFIRFFRKQTGFSPEKFRHKFT